jgi:hypothetical protein
MTEPQFIASVERVVPNPPFTISIQTELQQQIRDENSFRRINVEELKDHSWQSSENIREFRVDFANPDEGLLGSALVGVLQYKGQPVSRAELTSKTVIIDGTEFTLEKNLSLRAGKIEQHTSSITIDDDAVVRRSVTSSQLADSDSRLSCHGIEVPTTLFPDSWNIQRNQVKLYFPLPLLVVIDVSGEGDLDLNTSRTQVIFSEKWVAFERRLWRELASGLKSQMANQYWRRLKAIMLEDSRSDSLRAVLEDVDANT